MWTPKWAKAKAETTTASKSGFQTLRVKLDEKELRSSVESLVEAALGMSVAIETLLAENKDKISYGAAFSGSSYSSGAGS